MKTPSEMNLKALIGTQQDGAKTSEYLSSESIVNEALKDLKKIKVGWRAAFKSQVEVDGYKEQLLIACIENGINCQEMIDRGLSEARKDSGDFLPAVGKFVKWCKPKEEEEHWEHKRYRLELEESEKQRRLPKPPRDKSKGLEELRKIREMIK